jgi:hypothetical protein
VIKELEKGFPAHELMSAMGISYPHYCEALDVATLALDSRPREGLARVRAKRESWESHFMLLGV